MKPYQRLGLIGRFKPLHNGGAVMLEALCEQAEQLIVGIGSCNKYNVRNPFTAEESKEMIDAVLSPHHKNYKIIYVPDFAHLAEYADGQKWKEHVKKHFGNLDAFITGNAYLCELLKDDYVVIHPATLIPEDKKTRLRGSAVRLDMVRGGEVWKSSVPEAVAKYLEENKLVARFRKEFGLQTLSALVEGGDYIGSETKEEEKKHTKEK